MVKKIYRKIINVINNKSKCFLITKTWQVQAKDVKEAMLKIDDFDYLDISVKEKK